MKPDISTVTNADGSVSAVCRSVFADGAGSMADTDITIIIALWCAVVLVMSFLIAFWASRAWTRTPRLALIVPCAFLSAVWWLTPWLQFTIARKVRTASLGVASYGFIYWDVPNWLAPVVALITLAITITIGMYFTQQ
jgi:hypothetical protein